MASIFYPAFCEDQPQVTVADVLVAGLGPVGLACAVALAGRGLRVVAVGQAEAQTAGPRDMRATALMQPSLNMLANLGVTLDGATADANGGHSAEPLRAIRIIDATGRLLRAPEVTFRAEEIGRTQFGASIANADLLAALRTRARQLPNLTLIETAGIGRIDFPTNRRTRGNAGSSGRVILLLAEGRRLEGRMLVGADGRNSPSRAAAGITAQTWSYPQAAVVCTFGHAHAHDGVSIELHGPHGPLTTVPLPGRQSSLVWVEAPEEAKRLGGLDAAAFTRSLRAALHGVLGGIDGIGERAVYPLSALRATPLGRGRTALVGEAAHVIPPIGAQGLNLGLADVAVLIEALGAEAPGAEALGQAQMGQPQVGHGDLSTNLDAPAIVAAYAAARQRDVWLRTGAVDWLNRSLLSSWLPVQAARGIGLHTLSLVPPLRRALMQQGLAAPHPLPALMRAAIGGN